MQAVSEDSAVTEDVSGNVKFECGGWKQVGETMFFDWNGNGEIDPMDIGLTLAMIDEEERLRAEEEK